MSVRCSISPCFEFSVEGRRPLVNRRRLAICGVPLPVLWGFIEGGCWPRDGQHLSPSVSVTRIPKLRTPACSDLMCDAARCCRISGSALQTISDVTRVCENLTCNSAFVIYFLA